MNLLSYIVIVNCFLMSLLKHTVNAQFSIMIACNHQLILYISIFSIMYLSINIIHIYIKILKK